MAYYIRAIKNGCGHHSPRGSYTTIEAVQLIEPDAQLPEIKDVRWNPADKEEVTTRFTPLFVQAGVRYYGYL